MSLYSNEASRYRPVQPTAQQPMTPTAAGSQTAPRPAPRRPQAPVAPQTPPAPAAPTGMRPVAPPTPAPAPAAPPPMAPVAPPAAPTAPAGNAPAYRAQLASLIRGNGGFEQTSWDDLDAIFNGGSRSIASDPGTDPGSTTPPPGSPPPSGLPGAPIPPRPTNPPDDPIPPAPPAPPIDPGGVQFEDNLRGDAFLPGDDARLRQYRGATTSAYNDLYGTQDSQTLTNANADRYRGLFGTGRVTGATIDPNVAGGPDVDGEDSARYLDDQDAAIEGLGGPNRTELAQQALRDFDEVSAEDRFKEERDLGRNIAKFGRSGLQANADNFGDITRRIAGDRARYANDLAMGVSEGDISDRFRRVDTTSTLRGREAGIESGIRAEDRVERDYDTGLDERNVARRFDDRSFTTGLDADNQDRAFDRQTTAADLGARDAGNLLDERVRRVGTAQDVEDQIFNQGISNRNEFRTERDYQRGTAEDSLDRRVQERAISEQERSNRISRAIALQQAGGRVPNLDDLLGA